MSDPIIIESASIVLRRADGTTQTIDLHKGGEIRAAIEHQNDWEPEIHLRPEVRLRREPHTTERRYRFELTVVTNRFSDFSASEGNVYTVTDSALAGEASS
jgi:hypothetical protein